ncbi:MAG: amino acid ABC transporter permease [Firmicutes bacterium]|nr:amino acid ABC transporter permease [Bacillota bacterium]
MSFSNVIKIWTKYWKVFIVTGVSHTLLLSLITVVFGAILGFILCYMRMSSHKVLKGISSFIVDLIRGTPMLLQVYVGYFLVPKLLPFKVSEFMAVSVAFSINSGCYLSEAFRSGIQAVDRGQMEAARSLGLTYSQAMKKVILPQAIKNILPELGNEFVTITKDTSLASTFFIGDIMTSYLIVRGNTFLTFECLFIVAVIYYVINKILTFFLNRFERRLRVSD